MCYSCRAPAVRRGPRKPSRFEAEATLHPGRFLFRYGRPVFAHHASITPHPPPRYHVFFVLPLALRASLLSTPASPVSLGCLANLCCLLTWWCPGMHRRARLANASPQDLRGSRGWPGGVPPAPGAVRVPAGGAQPSASAWHGPGG